MKRLKKFALLFVLILSVSIFLSVSPLLAQFASYPSYFGTTSANNLWGYPITSTYSSRYWPYYGNPYSGYQTLGIGNLGYTGGTNLYSNYANTLQALMYYQYLTYAYQFYQIARQTPMFYQNDIIADYIGSALYSYIDKTSLAPQQAIFGFIQQYLL